MSRIKSLFNRIKNIKHLYVYIAIFVGALAMLFYFVTYKNDQSAKTNEISTTEKSSAVEYVEYLENKLSNVLSKISGIGETKVLITLASGFSYKYATDTETKTMTTNGNETTVTTETVILVSNEPVVEQQIYPVIKGVVVVAKGAENVNVKLNILSAIETVLDVDRNQITILS